RRRHTRSKRDWSSDVCSSDLKHNQARTGGAFLSLITKGGVDRVHDRFVEISIGIDNDCVLAAHLADDALKFALARSGFARRLPRSEEHTSELQSRFDLVCRLL